MGIDQALDGITADKEIYYEGQWGFSTRKVDTEPINYDLEEAYALNKEIDSYRINGIATVRLSHKGDYPSLNSFLNSVNESPMYIWDQPETNGLIGLAKEGTHIDFIPIESQLLEYYLEQF